jgi:hypothetical protein
MQATMYFAGTPEEKKANIIKHPNDYAKHVPGQPKRPIAAEHVAPICLCKTTSARSMPSKFHSTTVAVCFGLIVR